MTPKGHKYHLRKFVERWDIPWYIFTVVLYAVAVAALFIVFPDVSNTWIGIFILAAGFTQSIGTLITAIKSQKPEEENK
jgi:hypothetical protein